jgi:hypothetical protein
MSNRITGRKVNPDFGVVLHRRIGNQAECVSVAHGIQMTVSTREHRPVHRRPEAPGRVFGKWRRVSRHAVGSRHIVQGKGRTALTYGLRHGQQLALSYLLR